MKNAESTTAIRVMPNQACASRRARISHCASDAPRSTTMANLPASTGWIDPPRPVWLPRKNQAANSANTMASSHMVGEKKEGRPAKSLPILSLSAVGDTMVSAMTNSGRMSSTTSLCLMKNRSQSELGPSALMLNIEIEPMAMIAVRTSHKR
jgi:hypothetical protein